jgi:hypothetical protein
MMMMSDRGVVVAFVEIFRISKLLKFYFCVDRIGYRQANPFWRLTGTTGAMIASLIAIYNLAKIFFA